MKYAKKGSCIIVAALLTIILLGCTESSQGNDNENPALIQTDGGCFAESVAEMFSVINEAVVEDGLTELKNECRKSQSILGAEGERTENTVTIEDVCNTNYDYSIPDESIQIRFITNLSKEADSEKDIINEKEQKQITSIVVRGTDIESGIKTKDSLPSKYFETICRLVDPQYNAGRIIKESSTTAADGKIQFLSQRYDNTDGTYEYILLITLDGEGLQNNSIDYFFSNRE